MQNEKLKFKENFSDRLVKFSIDIIRLGEQLRTRRTLWAIIDQMIRSATSVGANITEAKSSSSKRDYLHFFEIALKSANETKYWLTMVREVAPDLVREVDRLYQEADEISKVIASSVLTLKGKR